jgi:hypothetical protein
MVAEQDGLVVWREAQQGQSKTVWLFGREAQWWQSKTVWLSGRRPNGGRLRRLSGGRPNGGAARRFGQ